MEATKERRIKIYDRGHSHFPDDVVNILGGPKSEVPFIPDAGTVVLIRDGMKEEDVIASLDLIKEHLKLRQRILPKGGSSDKGGKNGSNAKQKE